MQNYDYRTIGQAVKSFTATAGTISCGNARKVNIKADLTVATVSHVVFKPVDSATGTASIRNASGFLYHKQERVFYRPAGAQNWWIAWRIYNGIVVTAGTAGDRCVAEKLG